MTLSLKELLSSILGHVKPALCISWYISERVKTSDVWYSSTSSNTELYVPLNLGFVADIKAALHDFDMA